MQGANFIIECLIKESVTTMFGYPGGSEYQYMMHYMIIQTK